MTNEQQPLHVSLAGIPGSLCLPLTGLYEVLNAFPLLQSLYDGVPGQSPFAAQIVAADENEPLTGSGLRLQAHRTIDELNRTDIVIIPSMAGHDGYQWRTGQHAKFIDWLVRMHEKGAMLCSACSGALVLAETGLLDGRKATVHWAFAPAFRENFPDVELCIDEVLMTAGDRDEFVMSGATGSWHDLVLYLIARHVGPTSAQAMAKFMLLQWHAEGQAPFIPFAPSRDHGDAAMQRLQEWLDMHYSVTAPVDELARRSGLSARSLERRFKRATGYTPIDYVQRLRIEEARRRLERTTTSVDEISWQVGYENPAYFRRLFKRTIRLTPSDYRKKFQVPQAVS